jgi:hypothetical protein
MLTLDIKLPQNSNLETEKTKIPISQLKWNEKNKDIFINHMKAVKL